jgi:hypothetical protein
MPDMSSNFTDSLEEDDRVENFIAFVTHLSCLIKLHLRLNVLQDTEMCKSETKLFFHDSTAPSGARSHF